MANPFSKGWKYLIALFSSKIDEHADPRIEIDQAMAEASKRHKALTAQASAVIGSQRQIEMQLNRKLADLEKLNRNVRQALLLSDKARSEGNEQRAREYEAAAESFSTKLVACEQEVAELKKTHEAATQQAEQARAAVQANSRRLEQQVAERTKLLSQLEQAKMQEKVAESIQSMNAIYDSEVPTLDSVRDKIESRYAKALGASELAQNSVNARMEEIAHDSLSLEGASRLEQIRAELNGGSSHNAIGSSSSQANVEQLMREIERNS